MSMSVAGGVMWMTQGEADVSGLELATLAAVRAPEQPVLGTRQPVEAERWQAIVVHHSGDAIGSPALIAQASTETGLNGSPFHFVIGNGSGTTDGAIHGTPRWQDQQPGSHVRGAHADALNRTAIGICMVGDGDRSGFSKAQMANLVRLVQSLQTELGIPADRVYLHRDLAGTSSPGRHFPASAFRERLIISP